MGLSTLVPRPLLSQGPGLRWWPKKAYSASLALLVPSPLRHHTPGCVRLCWWLELVQCEEPSPQFCCLPVLVSARGLSESAAIPCILSATFSGLLGSGQLWFSGIHPSPHSAFPYCCVFPIRASHPQVQNTHTHTHVGGMQRRIGPVWACEGCFPWPVREHILLNEKECWPNSSLL